MEIKIIRAVYNVSDEIRPVGRTIEDKNGETIKCPKCDKGILYLEFETGKIKCTQCHYEE